MLIVYVCLIMEPTRIVDCLPLEPSTTEVNLLLFAIILKITLEQLRRITNYLSFSFRAMSSLDLVSRLTTIIIILLLL